MIKSKGLASLVYHMEQKHNKFQLLQTSCLQCSASWPRVVNKGGHPE